MGIEHDRPIEETADFLCRMPSEIYQRMREIAEADAIGDPSRLRDGLTGAERASIDNFRDAWDALALIREAIEDCAPPGSVTRRLYLPLPEATAEAEALVRGVYAIAHTAKQRPSG